MKVCKCCGALYSRGKEYGNRWTQDIGLERGDGYCEMCNENNQWFCCDKHGKPFRIGHFVYENGEKIYSPIDLNKR